MSELQTKIKESELKVEKEKGKNKELEEELLMLKKKVIEKHEKGFFKAFRQARFFNKGFELGLFDLFKDVKDDELLDEEEIATGEEDVEEEDDEPMFRLCSLWFFFILLAFSRIDLVTLTIIFFFNELPFLCCLVDFHVAALCLYNV